ncbi:MAG TPA: Crp/Fnr family transcriptional regulator [Deinococcales bacterium]|nr:Crp/Fnr family transcriptional regulator [Deinococcales bacterium]
MNQYAFLIQNVGKDVAERIAAEAHARRVKRNEVVAAFGEEPVVALVNQGWFKLARFTESGDEHVVAVRRHGEFIGLDTLSNPTLEMPEVLAMTTGHLLVWPRAFFDRLYAQDIRFVQAIAGIHANQLEQEVRSRVLNHSARVSARLAAILYQLATDQGERTAGGYKVTLPFTQEELAGLMTVRRETISVNLTELESEGVISRSGRSLLIDPSRVRSYLEMNGAL